MTNLGLKIWRNNNKSYLTPLPWFGTNRSMQIKLREKILIPFTINFGTRIFEPINELSHPFILK